MTHVAWSLAGSGQESTLNTKDAFIQVPMHVSRSSPDRGRARHAWQMKAPTGCA